MKVFNYLLATLCALNLGQVKAQCAATGSQYTASYPSGWNLTDLGDGTGDLSTSCGDNHNGTFYLSGTAAYFYTARDGRELRASRDIPTVSNTSWTMDFTVIINPSYYPNTLLPTNSPSVVLAALATDQMSLQSGCTGGSSCTPCSSYPNTNMDAMWVYLTSNAPGGCSENQTGKNWRIVAAARDGGSAQNTSTPISIPTTAGTYYVRLQRTSDGSGMVSVFSNSNFTGHLSGSPQCLTIPGSVTNLDVLTHEVHSQGECTRTFNGIVDHLKIDNGVTCSLALSPSFTCPSSICGVQSFTVNGSASTAASIPISTHLWVVEESDASGNQFGPVWYGPGISGAPSSNYTINPVTVAAGGLTMLPGHYYKVSLVVMNCGNPWTATSHVLYVNYSPTLSMAGSSTVQSSSNMVNFTPTVSGGTAPYVVAINTGYYYPNPTNLFMGAMPQTFATTQYSATTYYITAWNQSGCSTNMLWTIGDGSHRPAFTVALTSQNAAEYTLEAQPVDVTAYEGLDYAYTHTIQELDADGNALYSNTSTDCWNNYPDAESFKGFVSTETGSYTQASYPDCGDPGRFLIEHRYRLTTLMQTKDYGDQTYSVVVSVGKSGTLIVEADKSLSNVAHLLPTASAAEVTIFPNPGTGIFTIGLGEETAGSLIVVVDALGKTVKTITSTTGTQSELDLTGFTKGIYMVNITGNDGTTVTKKIILK